jgi:hypothetical protein
MSIAYDLKKKWLGLWQKYALKTHLKIAYKLLILFLVIWLIGSILTILSQWAYTDHYQGTPFDKKYLDYFWPVIIELVSGYDIQDAELKLNIVSRILSVFMLITGVIIFAIFTGQIVSMFIHVLQRINQVPEKPGKFVFKRPIIICGINRKLNRIIEELRSNALSENREIVVVDSDSDQLRIKNKVVYKDVWHVKGNQADRETLKDVIGEEDTSAIILSKEAVEGCRCSDSRAIETAMAIEGYREKVHTVLELIDERNIPHLKHTKINEWISVSDYGIRLTAQAALQRGMGNIFYKLLGNGTDGPKTTQIFFSQGSIPKELINLSYQDIREKVLLYPDIEITLIGFAKYVPQYAMKKMSLGSGNTDYINQLNPIRRKCRLCGSADLPEDRLGRIQRQCPDCSLDEKATPPWYFPVDTPMQLHDRLIYLSDGPVDFNAIDFNSNE